MFVSLYFLLRGLENGLQDIDLRNAVANWLRDNSRARQTLEDLLPHQMSWWKYIRALRKRQTPGDNIVLYAIGQTTSFSF